MQQMQCAISGLQHQSYIQDYGWSDVRNTNSMAGVTGQSKRLEALNLSINNLNTNVYYRFHIQSIG